jgi:hypothetical protein
MGFSKQAGSIKVTICLLHADICLIFAEVLIIFSPDNLFLNDISSFPTLMTQAWSPFFFFSSITNYIA